MVSTGDSAKRRLLGVETSVQTSTGKTISILYKPAYVFNWSNDWSIRWIGNSSSTNSVLTNSNIKLNYSTSTKKFIPEVNGQTISSSVVVGDSNNTDCVLVFTTSNKTLRFYQDGELVGSIVITADFGNTNNFTLQGSSQHESIQFFNASITSNNVRELHRLGNVASTNCIGHWIPDRSGTYMYDIISDNNAQLIGYSYSELGTIDKTTQTTYKDFYPPKTTFQWWKTNSGNPVYENGILVESKTNLPELEKCMIIPVGASISYPTGTQTIDYNGSRILAYKLKVGEVLTDRELFEITNNTLFRNPRPSILAKFDNYYQHQEVINGNEIKDWIGATNATITGLTGTQAANDSWDSIIYPISEVRVGYGLSHVKEAKFIYDTSEWSNLIFNSTSVIGANDRSGGNNNLAAKGTDYGTWVYDSTINSYYLNEGSYEAINIANHQFLFDGTPCRMYKVFSFDNTLESGSTIIFGNAISGSGSTGIFAANTAANRAGLNFRIYQYDSVGGTTLNNNLDTANSINTGDWNKLRLQCRGTGIVGKNDLELTLNSVTKVVATKTQQANVSPATVPMHFGAYTSGFNTLNYKLAFFIAINDTGKSDAQIEAEDIHINNLLSNKYGL